MRPTALHVGQARQKDGITLMVVIFGVGGVPFIAPKTNTTGGIGGLFEKMFHYFQYRRDDFMQHYHRRSNIETAFSALKRKFGDGVRTKCDTAMKNEVLSKILAYNLCVLIQEQHELGIDPVFWKDTSDTDTRLAERAT